MSNGLGIESRWGKIFPPVQTGPGAHPASCTMGTGSFPGVRSSRGVLLTTHPFLVLRSWKSIAIPLPTLWATTGLVTGSLYLTLPLTSTKTVNSIGSHSVRTQWMYWYCVLIFGLMTVQWTKTCHRVNDTDYQYTWFVRKVMRLVLYFFLFNIYL